MDESLKRKRSSNFSVNDCLLIAEIMKIASFLQPALSNYLYSRHRFTSNADGLIPVKNGCKQTIDASVHGTILSPNFGISDYPPDTICTWLLTTQGKTIRLQFNTFKLENTRRCSHDYVRVFDGVSSFSPVLGVLCGDFIPGDIVSTDDHLLIMFRTDSVNEYTGFNITYTPEVKSLIVDVFQDDGCHGKLKVLRGTTRGSINSPGYDGHSQYRNNAECNWVIEAPPGNVIRLMFHDFLTEKISGCVYDYVAVYDGSTNSSTKLTQLCGLAFPEDIYSSGPSLFIKFNSDDDVAGTGFNLTYEVLHESGKCDKFRCGDGSCIFHQFVCNNYTECPDHSDELVCENDKCGRPVIHPIETNRKIVGGRMALAHSWPWMISLQVNDSHVCGGALIHESYVLTAAHCFEGNRHTIEWTAVAGKVNKLKTDNTEQVRHVERIIVHSGYYYLTTVNDIAVVKLDVPFNLNTYISLVCLPDKPPQDGHYGFVTGWGEVLGTCCQDVLKQVMLPVVPISLCIRSDHLGNQVTDDMFCAGFEQGGQDACQGDSGGPFVMRDYDAWKIQGITSFGSLCAAPKSPGVYTKVFNYIEWIREKVAANF